MEACIADANEAYKQLQKLVKELNPVKTAISAIIKRETASPNLTSAAASLDKVATRLQDVLRKYQPYGDRLQYLMDHELPASELVSYVMKCSVQRTTKGSQRLHSKPPGSRPGAKGGIASAGGQAGGSDSSHAGSPASLNGTGGEHSSEVGYGSAMSSRPLELGGVAPSRTGTTKFALHVGDLCPPNAPHVLGYANYAEYKQHLRLRIDMVDYLIQTRRLQLAKHVAMQYKLPLFMFPKLAALALSPLEPIKAQPANTALRSSPQSMSLNSISPGLFGVMQGPDAVPLSLPPSVIPRGTESTASLSHTYSGVEPQLRRLVRNSSAPSPGFHALASPRPPAQPLVSVDVAPEDIAMTCIQTRHSVVEALAYVDTVVLPLLDELPSVRHASFGLRMYDLLMTLHVMRIFQLHEDKDVPQHIVIEYLSANLLPYATRQPLYIQEIISVLTAKSVERVRKEALPSTSIAFEAAATGAPGAKAGESRHPLIVAMLSSEQFDHVAMNFHRVVILGGLRLMAHREAHLRLLQQMQARQTGARGPAEVPGSGGGGSGGGGGDRNEMGYSEGIDPASARQLESNDRSIVVVDDEAAAPLLPDLVARVVASAIFLKDEYVEQLVLRMRAEQQLLQAGLGNRILAAKDALSAMESEYCGYAGESCGRTASAVSSGLWHNWVSPDCPASMSQSGSVAFDRAMMAIAAEVVRHNPFRVLLAKSKSDKYASEPHPNFFSNPEYLLYGDEQWSNCVLNMKHPTRFFCCVTGECLDGSQGDNSPVALPNGVIVSQRAVSSQLLRVHRDGEDDEAHTMVQCPRTGAVFRASSVRKVFIT